MFDGEYDCKDCKRQDCLKQERFVRLSNIPTSCVLYDRIFLLNRNNFWIFLDLLIVHLPVKGLLSDYVEIFTGICPKSVLDNQVYHLINRYFYCKEFNIQPFNGSYDDQPSKWLFMCNIIKSELNELEKKRSQIRPK